MEGSILSLGTDVHLRIPSDTFDCCARCGFSGGDVRIIGCGCIFHTVSSYPGRRVRTCH